MLVYPPPSLPPCMCALLADTPHTRIGALLHSLLFLPGVLDLRLYPHSSLRLVVESTAPLHLNLRASSLLPSNTTSSVHFSPRARERASRDINAHENTRTHTHIYICVYISVYIYVCVCVFSCASSSHGHPRRAAWLSSLVFWLVLACSPLLLCDPLLRISCPPACGHVKDLLLRDGCIPCACVSVLGTGMMRLDAGNRSYRMNSLLFR